MRTTMRARAPLFLALPAALLLALGAWAASAGAAHHESGGKHDLSFRGNGSFNGAHGGQAIQVAVVEAGSGKVVAQESGTVSGSANPAFAFTFEGVLKDGERYEVHYWIDSNFGGGDSGACDRKQQDHQWKVSLGRVSGDVSRTEQHQPGNTASVCDTFN